ncbi:MAG: glycosyltransferase family 39 protein [Mariniphaga sp.]|nr:glycosyltransferase family 39 protein [Mariniphaga sp.]
MQNNRLSKWTIVFLVIICGWYGKNLDTWGKNTIIQNDVISYYAYLPATFIFHDLSFDFINDLPEDFEGTIWVQTAPNGKSILRMTMGMSILWIPFFLLAHLVAHLLGVSTLGYSWPYSLSIFVAALFYMAVGLYYLRKILLRYFSDVVAAITLALVILATNLMYYVITEPGMTHVYNFSLITAFVWFSVKWIEKPTVKYTLVLGFLAGLITLIRPVNVLVLVFPAFIGIASWRDFKDRLAIHWKKIVLAGFIAFLVFVPQMVYWKLQTGQFVFNSYMDQGKFFFLKPHILNGLFSYRKGRLVYTPVMALAFVGLIWMRRKAGELLIPVILFTLVNIYVVFSWWCWWYGGSFGSRPMIDMYGIMALPLAVLIEKLWERKNWVKDIMITVLIALILLSQFQMSQYRTSLLHWDSMTKEAYWGIFGKKQWPEGYDRMIQAPDYDKALRGEKEYN